MYVFRTRAYGMYVHTLECNASYMYLFSDVYLVRTGCLCNDGGGGGGGGGGGDDDDDDDTTTRQTATYIHTGTTGVGRVWPRVATKYSFIF